MSSNIIISTAPCSWGVWYADGSPSFAPYDLFLDQAAACGYKELEMGPDGYLPVENDRLHEELEKRGLDICAGTICHAFEKFTSVADMYDQLDNLCARLNSFDAKYIVTMDESEIGRNGGKNSFTKAEWGKYFTMFREMGKYTLENFGVEVVFHPHIGSLIETEQEILNLMDETGLDLCLDIGHHEYINGTNKNGDRSNQDFILRFPERIKYLHFKNVDSEVSKRLEEGNLESLITPDFNIFCDLEDGVVDYVDLKNTLDQINFNGIGVIEQDLVYATNEERFGAAKRNLEYLRRIKMID